MKTGQHEIPSPRMGEGPSANADMRRLGGGSRASNERQFSLAAPTPSLPRFGGGGQTAQRL